MSASKLSDLHFTDLYVSMIDGKACFQSVEPTTRKLVLADLPVSYADELAQLLSAFDKSRTNDVCHRFSHDGINFRATQVILPDQQPWVVLQPIEKTLRPLEELGFKPPILNLLQSLGTRTGLILVSGGICQGKTTTAAALLQSFLRHQGGVACTLEDPIEYRLSGRHGEHGLCYQFEVHKKRDWESMLADCLQLHPRYLMMGELRAPEMTSHMLRAATSGLLTITNIHAGSLEEALEGILQFAERAIGNHAPILLAAALTAIIHQQVTPTGLEARILVTDPFHTGDPCRTLIRERRIGQLSSVVDQQMARLK